MTIEAALNVVWQVTGSGPPEQMIRKTPTLEQLEALKVQGHQTVVEAIETIKQYYYGPNQH